MALFLLITYIVILIFQIILFVISIRKKTKKLWRILFSAELVPLLRRVRDEREERVVRLHQPAYLQHHHQVTASL